VHLSVWWVLFLAQLLPVLYIFSAAIANQLGAEPAKALVEYLGEAALYLLIATLAITPLKRVSVIPSLLRYRRMIGLFAFFYAAIHMLSYGLFLVDWTNFIEDLYRRAYVSAGLLAFLILLALAVTSPKSMVRRLGKKWKSLHRMVYLAAIIAVIHVFWQVRSNYSEAIVFAVVVAGLLCLRLPLLNKSRRA